MHVVNQSLKEEKKETEEDIGDLPTQTDVHPTDAPPQQANNNEAMGGIRPPYRVEDICQHSMVCGLEECAVVS